MEVQLRCVILLALCLASATGFPRNAPRIVGGDTTSISEYPAIAALLYSWSGTNYRQACGGNILNTRSILTAAHCTSLDEPHNWRVRVGSTYANIGGTVYIVSQLINHEDFNWDTADNDIGILRLATEIVYNNRVTPAFFAGSNYNVADNSSVWYAGWGALSEYESAPSSRLRHVEVWTVNQEICRKNYALVDMTITDNMLCAGYLTYGGRDQCSGDSGGPLYHNNVVIGVCSFSYRCARAEFPGVNVRVSRYTNWISDNA